MLHNELLLQVKPLPQCLLRVVGPGLDEDPPILLVRRALAARSQPTTGDDCLLWPTHGCDFHSSLLGMKGVSASHGVFLNGCNSQKLSEWQRRPDSLREKPCQSVRGSRILSSS